jgi:hypothetical protein
MLGPEIPMTVTLVEQYLLGRDAMYYKYACVSEGYTVSFYRV